MSPRSVLHSIIDQCYNCDNDDHVNMSAELNNESIFEFSRKMAEKHNPIFMTIDQADIRDQVKSQKSCIRPSSIIRKYQNMVSKPVLFPLSTVLLNSGIM